jgi:hypothetical protein
MKSTTEAHISYSKVVYNSVVLVHKNLTIIYYYILIHKFLRSILATLLSNIYPMPDYIGWHNKKIC